MIAALGVVAFHAAERAGIDLRAGAAGVDVFFVISGVIIWIVTQGRQQTPAAFLLDRLTRIAPAYVLLTLGVAAVAIMAPGVFPRLQVTTGHVLQSILFIPHLDPEGRPWPLVVPGWTLTYEMFFYVLFAGALLTARRMRALCVTALIGGATAWGAMSPFDSVIGQTYTNGIMLEFVAGIWIGVAWTRGTLLGRRTGWLALACGVAGFALSPDWASLWPDLPGLVHWGLPSILVVAGVLSIEAAGGMPTWPVGVALGNASYSMYLVSGLVVSTSWRVLGAHSTTLFLAASLLGTIFAGMAFSRLVELPATRLLRGLRMPSVTGARSAAA